MPNVLMRELLGQTLREVRMTSAMTLREVSSTARVSLGYLSEVERGQKEASSELLGAICTARTCRSPKCCATSPTRPTRARQ